MPANITSMGILADGSLDWSGGVDSVRVPTIQSQQNPNGLARNQLAWLDNATVRDGGISPRGGYGFLGVIHDPSGVFQGELMYAPINANPYKLVAISGQIYKVQIDPSFAVTNLSAIFGLTLPLTDQYFFVQGQQFAVIQAGDNVTLPLFWDGNILRQSRGITNTAVAPGTPGVNEIPAATAMDYFMGRIWYAQGKTVSAGDIVKGPSGTAPYQFNDSILNVTENPLVLGGDGFSVPTEAGNIRAVFHNANLNTALGQGNLFIGTRRAVYSLNVPVSRNDWIAATNNTQPLMTVVQLVNGPVNDRSVVQVNGDVYYQALEPSVRSLLAAIRYFNQPGNIEISAQENRVLQFNDRALMRFGTGIEFGSRLYESALPKQLPQGVIHQALMPLDFIPMSSFQSNQNPIWEGMTEGLQHLQLSTGDYGGLQRAFSTAVSELDSSIVLYELSEFNRFDANQLDNSARIQWYAEFPSFTCGDEFMLKRLIGAELWVDRIYGTVMFQMDYRSDGETCWLPWHVWKVCSARNSCEDVHNPICYPIQPFGEGYRSTMTLPVPPSRCEVANRRPSDWCYQAQPRLTVRGFCRIRGLILYFERKERQLYAANVCGDLFTCPEPIAEIPNAPGPPVLPQIFMGACPGVAFSQLIQATQGSPPFTYSIISGALPVGLSFTQTDPFSARITGTAIVAYGDFTFTIQVQDSAGQSTTQSYTISLIGTIAFFPNPTINVPYSFNLETVIVGGTTPRTYQLCQTFPNEALPPGLTLSSAGVISGTPTASGFFNFQMIITDAHGLGAGCCTEYLIQVNA